MAAHIRPGMRMVTMENKSNWYFLQVPNRNHDSHIGFLDAIDDQSITLVRPQIAANELMPIDGKADRYRSVNYQDRPHWRYNIPLSDDAVVKIDGTVIPWRQAQLTPDPKQDFIPWELKESDEDPYKQMSQRARNFCRKGALSRNSLLVLPTRERMQ